MKSIHLKIVNGLIIICFFLAAGNAQHTKKHTEKFSVDEEVNIHVNTTHTNVRFETWDRNEIEVTFIIEANEKVEESFEKWNFEATGNRDKVTIESGSGYYFNAEDFQFDFDMGDFNFNMDNFDFDLSNLDLEIDNMVSDIMDGLNLEDMPKSPFGKDADFNGDKYRENPDAYLKELNKKYGTQVTRPEVDRWLEDLEVWAENIDVKVDESVKMDLSDLNRQIEEQTKKLRGSVKKWEKENEVKIKEMTEQIEKQLKGMDLDRFQNHNYFDQDRSDVKKTIHIKLPKKAKLHLNVRYGEVTLAENLRNVNADLNYASLTANTVKGKDTDISAAFAPVFVRHWQNGRLNLKHCNDIIIEKATKIKLKAQGTDIVIGTLLNSGLIQNAYGDLEIQNLGTELKDLELTLDYGSALLYLPSVAVDLSYTGNRQSSFSLPQKCRVVSDTNEGLQRVVRAYNQTQNSGNILSVYANYGDLTIK